MSLRISSSLRARLLLFLLVPVVLVGIAQSYMAYRTALDEADAAFDYHMEQVALALRAGLQIGAVDALVSPRIEQENLDFVVQVWTTDGRRVFESAEHAELPQQAVLGFSTVQARGMTYRVLSMQTPSQVIQIAQGTAARREIASRLALKTIAPVVLLAPLLMIIVWWVVTQALRPIARVRQQVANRQANDLSPLDGINLPDEIQPTVHELNLLFSRLRLAFNAQESFVADAAHELRSPLAALRLQVQGLQRATSDDARSVAVTRLIAGIDRATHLVEQLLVLAKQEAEANAKREAEPFVLRDISRLALEDTLRTAREKNIDLGIRYADDAIINGHPEAVRVLVRNLLDNAVKYSPSGGTVDLEIRAVPGSIELTVEDCGPGIPVEDQERVLDRFYRVNGAQAGGSGLGLAIVKSIAELHGATVVLGNSSRLAGAKASVRFPVQP